MEIRNNLERARLYRYEKKKNKFEKRMKPTPGRYYRYIQKIYKPILYSTNFEYCQHLGYIPKWIWREIQQQASDILNYEKIVKHSTTPQEQLEWLEKIVSGVPPAKIRILDEEKYEFYDELK